MVSKRDQLVPSHAQLWSANFIHTFPFWLTCVWCWVSLFTFVLGCHLRRNTVCIPGSQEFTVSRTCCPTYISHNFISSVKIFKAKKQKPKSQMLTKQLPNLDERRFNTFYRAPVTTDLFIPIFYESGTTFQVAGKTMSSVCSVKSQHTATTLQWVESWHQKNKVCLCPYSPNL